MEEQELQKYGTSVLPTYTNFYQQEQSVLKAADVFRLVFTLGTVNKRPTGFDGLFIAIAVLLAWPIGVGLLVGLGKHSAKKGLLASFITIIVILIVAEVAKKFDDWKTKQDEIAYNKKNP